MYHNSVATSSRKCQIGYVDMSRSGDGHRHGSGFRNIRVVFTKRYLSFSSKKGIIRSRLEAKGDVNVIARLKKGIASAIVMASVLASSPANAGVVIAYYSSWPGNLIGYQVYCDSGALYEEYGVIGGVAIIDFVSVPC